MKIKMNEDYYVWHCDWCDTRNRVLWTKIHEGLSCGACHKKNFVGGETLAPQELKISSGLY